MKPNQFWCCKIAVMNVLGSIQCSTYLIIAMTFERFYSIIRPHKAASFNTVKRAKIIIAFTYVFSFLFNVQYLFIGDNDDRFCIPNSTASANVYGELYYWLYEVISFILPFVSLLTMNSVIIHTLRQRSRQKLTRSELKVKMKVKVKMLLLVTFGYLILITPGKVLIFYLNFYSVHTAYYYAGLHLLFQVGEKTLYTNHGINFLFYVMSGQKFRTDLKNLFISRRKAKPEGIIYPVASKLSVISN